MISIGKRVKHAIDDYNRKEFELALEHVSIAIDITARKHFGKTASSKTDFKNLITQYHWLLELMAFGGINLDETKFGNFPFKSSYGKKYNEPTLADIVYHIVRCSLLHWEGIPPNLAFSDKDEIIIAKEVLVLPQKIIWGLLGIVVFCPANKEENTEDEYYLSIFDRRFVINENWGNESEPKSIFENRKMIRVAINFPYNHFWTN